MNANIGWWLRATCGDRNLDDSWFQTKRRSREGGTVRIWQELGEFPFEAHGRQDQTCGKVSAGFPSSRSSRWQDFSRRRQRERPFQLGGATAGGACSFLRLRPPVGRLHARTAPALFS